MRRAALLLSSLLFLASPALAQTSTVGEVVSGTVVRGELAPNGLGTSASAVVVDVPPGLVLWLDADDPGQLTDAGSGALSVWDDKAQGFGPVSQPTSGNRPTITADAVNGRTAVLFDASASQYLEVDSALFNSYRFTIWAVVVVDGGNGFANVVLNVVDKDSFFTNTSLIVSTTTPSFFVWTTSTYASFATANVTLDQPALLTAWTVANNNRRITLDGGNEGSNTTGQLISGVYDRTCVGRYGDSTPAGYFGGYVCEVMVSYGTGSPDGDVGAAVRAQVEAYLRAKWGTP